MMRLDTSGIAGWEDRTVVLEFEHDTPMADYDEDGNVIRTYPRHTHVRLVEFVEGDTLPRQPAEWWKRVPSGWKRTITSAKARCSPEDQFCRETGRRVALRRLAAKSTRGTYNRLRKAAVRQYGEAQYSRLRARRRKAEGGLTDEQAIAFWTLMMVSDPWPAGGIEHDTLLSLANAEAKRRGYDSWVVAFHEFKKGVAA